MKIWSKGLGRIELIVDLCHYSVDMENNDTVIKGVTNEPVQWNFTITLEENDVPGLLNILFKPRTLLFVLINFKYAFRFMFEKLFRRNRYSEIIHT